MNMAQRLDLSEVVINVSIAGLYINVTDCAFKQCVSIT